jgi:hypothetical protein
MTTLETSTPPILVFTGRYGFLHNFHRSSILMGDGIRYRHGEGAFHGQKSSDMAWRQKVARMEPWDAKAAGRAVHLDDVAAWDARAKLVMLRVELNKFLQHPRLREDLVATGDALLVEGNRHHDNRWGDCHCGDVDHPECEPPGTNWLGQILMHVRFVLT